MPLAVTSCGAMTVKSVSVLVTKMHGHQNKKEKNFRSTITLKAMLTYLSACLKGSNE